LKVSLIISTLNRSVQLQELLESLAAQSVRATQIVVVDQGDGASCREAIASYEKALPLIFIKQNQRGLSRGRNEGWKHVDGELVAFPDDDCWYPPYVIEKVTEAFSNDPTLEILTGMSVTHSGRPSQGRWGQASHAINRYNIWTSQTSYTTFYRCSVLSKLGGFDESLGVGLSIHQFRLAVQSLGSGRDLVMSLSR
jgi:glycosyltransferase involved in cell wall biosynthesis